MFKSFYASFLVTLCLLVVVQLCNPPLMSDNSLNPGISYTDSSKIQYKFDGSSLKQEKISFTYKQGQIYMYCLWDKFVAMYCCKRFF